AVYALVFALGGAALADEKVAPGALKDVEGDCVLTGFDGKGVKLSRDDLRKLPYARRDVVVTADQIVADLGGKKEAISFKVDNTKTPRHIDLTTVKENKTETNYGIYTFENGVLTLCLSAQGEAKDRPTEIKIDDKTVVFRLQLQPRK